MLKTIHPNVIADTTILHEEKRKGIDYFEFRCMIDVFGYRFLLYKRMQGDVDRFDPNQAPLLQRMALLYRMSVTMYTFLFHSIGNNNFHRDIKPANILYTLQKLPTGESDFEVKIGDLGLFTSSPDELIGTPNFMCVMTQPLIKDQACLRNFNGDVKLATFANEVYAYTNTLLSLCEKWKIPCEKLIKLLKTRLTAIKSPNFQKIAKEESYLYTFTEFAVYPIDIADMLGSLLKREQVIKPFGHANINIYTNSIFSNMALDELNSYMIKHKQVLPKYNNEIYLQTIGLTMKGPFAFSFVTCCYLQGVSMNNADGKDFQDILYLYLWNVSKN